MIYDFIRSEKRYLYRLLVFRFIHKPRWILKNSATGKRLSLDDIPEFKDIYHAHKTLLHDPLLSCLTTQESCMSTFIDIVEKWWVRSQSLYIDYHTRHSNLIAAAKSCLLPFQSSFEVHASHGTPAKECLVAPFTELNDVMGVFWFISKSQRPEEAGLTKDLYHSIKSIRSTFGY